MSGRKGGEGKAHGERERERERERQKERDRERSQRGCTGLGYWSPTNEGTGPVSISVSL